VSVFSTADADARLALLLLLLLLARTTRAWHSTYCAQAALALLHDASPQSISQVVVTWAFLKLRSAHGKLRSPGGNWLSPSNSMRGSLEAVAAEAGPAAATADGGVAGA